MGDSRAIDETLLRKYRDEEGVFYPFNKFIRNHLDKLAVCFRGNGNPAQISIYHNNHIVWNLYEEGGEGKISISFNHARYCEDWEERLEQLGKCGFNIYDSEGKRYTTEAVDSIGYLVCNCSSKEYFMDPNSFVFNTYEIIMGYLDVYFTPKKNEDMDYFKGKMTTSKHNYAEKRWQQWLFNSLKYSKNGLFAYDLEFSQPGGALTDETNEPDMLAVRYKDGIPQAIVLVEVKTLFSACAPRKMKNGRRGSDIYEHLKGMRNYSVSKNVISRREEVHDILSAYKDLGIYVKKDQIIPEKNNNLPVECMLIMTSADLIDIGYRIKSANSAIHYYLTYKDEVDSARKSTDSDWCCDIKLIGDFSKNRNFPAEIYNLPTEWN